MKEQEDSIRASSARLNQLRAAVLGANDGIVSTAAVVMGAAGATSDSKTIITAGMAALVAGAFSMAVGEYVSVSSQSDAEKYYVEHEKKSLAENPEEELEELTQAYIKRGISPKTAKVVAKELTEKDALKAHLETEFAIVEDEIVRPHRAAIASFWAFGVGGTVPFLLGTFAPDEYRVVLTLLGTLIALALTGYISAKITNVSRVRAVARIVIGGFIAMAVTYLIGKAFGAAVF